MTKLCIGIDIGGTNLKAGLLTDRGTLLEEHMLQLGENDKSEEGMVQACASTVEKLLAVSGFGQDSVIGVGIGAAGVIDAESGYITQSPNFPSWKNFALAKRLGERLNMLVSLENDVNAVARGEQWCGAVNGEKNFLCMAIGTGLGGAICLDGNIWRGVGGMAGEIGHVNIDPDGPACNCGSNGCLETFASSTALIRRVKEDNFREVLDVVERDSAIPHKLALLAQEGDKAAQVYWDELGRAIGLALGGLLNTLNLKIVLLGGGLAKSFSLFYPALEAELQKRAFPAVWKGVEFRTSQLWEQAGVFGAAANLLIDWKRLQKKI
jgi:glucokinase